MIKYCPCKDETVNPCPACGADVNNINHYCKAKYGYKEEPYLEFILVLKE